MDVGEVVMAHRLAFAARVGPSLSVLLNEQKNLTNSRLEQGWVCRWLWCHHSGVISLYEHNLVKTIMKRKKKRTWAQMHVVWAHYLSQTPIQDL